MSSYGAGSATPATPIVYAPLAEDGQEVVKERRRQRHKMYMFGLVGYLFCAIMLYYVIEGWSPLESLVFTLSIVTGVGYGHVAPSTQLSMFVTGFFIISGLVMFAVIAGQVLDYVMQLEIEAAADFVHKASDVYESKAAGTTKHDEAVVKKHHDTYREVQAAARKQQFQAGCMNLTIIYFVAVIWFHFGYGIDFCEAMYLASLSVMKLDSLCTIEAVKCAPNSHQSRGGEATDLLVSIVWALIVYSAIAHFLTSACNFMGHDPEPVMTKVNHMSKTRWARMDKDGDGRIHRADFLRDRLIQGNICEAKQIDEILANFASLDKDKSGSITAKDVA